MEQDIELLKGGLLSKTDFIANYGEEAYNAAIGVVVEPQPETPTPQVQPDEEQTFFDRALDTIQTIGDGAVDIGQGVITGAGQAVGEFADTVNSAGEVIEEALGTGRLVWEDSDGDGKTDMLPSYWSRAQVKANQAQLKQDAITNAVSQVDDVINDYIPEPDTMVGGMAEGISQFLTGFMALGGARTFAGAMLKGGIVDATVFDPYEGNLSSFVEEFPHLRNPVTQALAIDPNDPEYYNRAKNALEGGATGAVLEGLIRGVKFVALSRKANTEIKELGQITDETADQLDEAHRDVLELEEAQRVDGKLQARPDGTFEAPDGMVYKPEGEKLVGIDTVKPLDEAPVVGEASQLPQPTLREQGEALAAQVEDVKVSVKPKIELIDTDAMQKAMARSIEMGDFELRNIDESGWFNLGRMEGPVEAAKVIDSMQEVLMGSRGAKAMGLTQPETHEQVVKQSLKFLAENTGTDVNKIIRDLGVTESVSRDMAARIVAGKVALQSTGREISAFAKKVQAAEADGTLNKKMETQLINLMQMHVELQANVKGLQTAAARATSAGRIATADTLTGDTLDVLSAFGGSKRVRNLAKELAKVKDDAMLSKTIKKAVDRKFLRVLNEYWINSILSGPTTHALNMTANTFNMLVRPAERAIGAGFNLDGKEMKAAARTYYYMYHNLSDAIKMAAKSGWNQRPILDESVKFDNVIDGSTQRAISSEFLGFGGSTMDILGKALTIPSRMLGTEDEFFKQLAYRSTLQARLVTDAAYMSIDDIKKAGYNTRDEWVKGEFDKAFTSKIDAEEQYQEAVMMGKIQEDDKVKEEFIRQAVGSTKKGNKYAEAALFEARSTTFTNPLKEDTLSYDIQVLANKHPFLRQIIPFIQTPMNIMGQAWDRTPLFNLLRKQYKAELSSPDPAIVAQAKGKMAMGVAIYATLGMLAANGRITGGGPTDPKRAALWRNSPNWQPYSINVGSQEKPYWISYARMDPWTTAFGIVGDVVEMVELGQMADSDGADIAAMFVAAVGNNIVSKTYLQGIADTVDLMNAKDSPWEVGNFFQRRMASLMPFSSLTNQVGNLQDDYMREARGYVDTLKKQNGAMRADLPIKFDWVTGQPLDTPDTFGPLFHITTKGVEKKDEGAAVIYDELRKLGVRFEGARRTVGGVQLTSEQYQRWNELIGTEKRGRKTLQERLVKIINSEKYNKDGDDYNLVTPSESHRVALINREIKRYRERALDILKREYPVIREQMRAYDRFVQDTRRGRESERPEVNLDNLE